MSLGMLLSLSILSLPPFFFFRLCSSGPLARNSNLGLLIVLNPCRASQFQYNFLRSVSYWSGRKKKPVICCVEFPTSLMFDMPFGLSCYTMPEKLVQFGIRCFLSLSILNVILFVAIYHHLLVKPHPASPQPLPANNIPTKVSIDTYCRPHQASKRANRYPSQAAIACWNRISSNVC